MNKRFLTLAMLTLLILGEPVHAVADNGSITIPVSDTELANLTNVMDIINQIPGVNYANDEINVDGRGAAEVYINDRRLTELTELWHTPANKVEYVEVVTNPGAQYDKSVRAVLIIHLKAVTDNGFTLDNTLSFDYTTRLSTNDELSLAWKQNRLNAGFFAGWNQSRQQTLEEDYSTTYKDKKPDSGTKDILYPYSHSQQLTLKGNLGYDFTPLHHIEAAYTFQRVPRSSVWVDEIESSEYAAKGGSIDFSTPTSTTIGPGMEISAPQTRHIFNMEYRGYIKQWTLSVGSNVTVENRDYTSLVHQPESTPQTIDRDQVITRSYVKASLPVGEGKFDAGVEFNSDNMKLKVDRHRKEDIFDKLYNYHTNNSDMTAAAYINLSQTFGIWTLAGGLRYEDAHFRYKPYDDDGLMFYLDKTIPGLIEKMGGITDDIISQYKYLQLWRDRKITNNNRHIYPNLSISTSLGKSTLSLSYSISRKKAYLAYMHLGFDELSDNAIYSKMVRDERVTTTVLDWKWNWLAASLTYNRHTDPVLTTLSLINSYNGKEYDDLDLNIAASPTIGFWHPSVSFSLHKQWLEVDGVKPDRLKKPFVSIGWTNSFNLPKNWLILVNADWHSKGAKSNTYYYSENLNMDASVQKTFTHPNLSVKLQLSDIFRNSYDDVTVYTGTESSSVGYAVRNPRVLSLIVKYHF